MDYHDLYRLAPEFELIADEELRLKTARAMSAAIEKGGWEAKGLHNCPVAVGKYGESCRVGWLEHTRQVAGAAEEMYAAIAPWSAGKVACDHDTVIAGALLHGIGKLLQYDLDEAGKPCQSADGHLFRYPISGAWLAYENGLPLKVVHIVLSISDEYSPDGPKARRTPESIIVYQAEAICSGLLKALFSGRKEGRAHE